MVYSGSAFAEAIRSQIFDDTEMQILASIIAFGLAHRHLRSAK